MLTSMQSLALHPATTQVAKTLHENKTWKALGVEVLGINMPKSLIVRTKDEAIDVAVNEFGNTVGFFGGLWGGGYLLDKVLKAQRLKMDPNPLMINQARVMKSLALIPPLFAFMVSTPFFRNAYTAWRTGTTDYKNLITKGNTLPESSARQFKHHTEAVQHNLRIGGTILGAGLGLGLLGWTAARGLGPLRLFQPNGKKLIPFFNNEWGKKIIKAFSLTGKNATEFGDMRAVFFWGIPAYLGWMAASRDEFEVKEQFLKMVNFIAVYVLTDKVVNRFFNKEGHLLMRKNPKLYPEARFSYAMYHKLRRSAGPALRRQLDRALKFENTRLFTGLGMTIALMAALPALLNIYLTQKRIERKQQQQAHATLQDLKALHINPFKPSPYAPLMANMANSGYALK